MDLTFDADISSMNTFGMKVKAACVADYYSIEELDSISHRIDLPLPLKSIGGGSNLLFTADFPGTLLHSKIRFISPYSNKGGVTARVGAGVPWDEFCEWCSKRDLWGPENLSSIPGDTGAAAVQNIGAYGVEIADIVSTVECYDLQSHNMVAFSRNDCAYGYRDSFFKNAGAGRYVVTAVSFCLRREYSPVIDYGNVKDRIIAKCGSFSVYGNALTPDLVRHAIMDIRREKLPDVQEYGSAGSFFRNPYITKEKYASIEAMGWKDIPHFFMEDGLVKIPAAWLIDKSGLKGRSHGGAAVWDKQPLVIVNRDGNATPADVLALEKEIVDSVEAKFGINLKPEVEHI